MDIVYLKHPKKSGRHDILRWFSFVLMSFPWEPTSERASTFVEQVSIFLTQRSPEWRTASDCFRRTQKMGPRSWNNKWVVGSTLIATSLQIGSPQRGNTLILQHIINSCKNNRDSDHEPCDSWVRVFPRQPLWQGGWGWLVMFAPSRVCSCVRAWLVDTRWWTRNCRPVDIHNTLPSQLGSIFGMKWSAPQMVGCRNHSELRSPD
jgi:hypothetical protein